MGLISAEMKTVLNPRLYLCGEFDKPNETSGALDPYSRNEVNHSIRPASQSQVIMEAAGYALLRSTYVLCYFSRPSR